MERKEQRDASSSSGRRGRGRGRSEASDSDPRPCEDGTVVQRTQVLLLAGEPWGSDGGQAVLSSFAHHVLTPTGDTSASPSSPTDCTLATGPGEPGARQPLPPTHPLPSAPSGQLIFFLCRASSLRDRPERMREVLQGVRTQSRNSPAALVGVIVQPRPEEEKQALGHLEELLREIFQSEGAALMEVHTAVFAPGRPDGVLELKRVKNRRSASLLRSGKSMMKQIFGAVLSFGVLVYGGYYFYNNPPL